MNCRPKPVAGRLDLNRLPHSINWLGQAGRFTFLFAYTDKFEDPNIPGEIRATVTLKQVPVGMEISIVQEGLPDAIPVEACYLGWQESLRNLSSRRSLNRKKDLPATTSVE